jgi:hypothetical protein
LGAGGEDVGIPTCLEVAVAGVGLIDEKVYRRSNAKLA